MSKRKRAEERYPRLTEERKKQIAYGIKRMEETKEKIVATHRKVSARLDFTKISLKHLRPLMEAVAGIKSRRGGDLGKSITTAFDTYVQLLGEMAEREKFYEQKLTFLEKDLNREIDTIRMAREEPRKFLSQHNCAYIFPDDDNVQPQ